MRRLCIAFFRIALVCPVIGALALAHAPAAAQAPPPGASLDLSAVYQFDADVDETGGAFSRSRLQTGFEHWIQLPAQRTLQFDIDYAWDQYDFSGEFIDPWETVHRVGLSLALRAPVRGPWSALVIVSGDLAGESGAAWDRSATGGGVVALSREMNRRLVLGAGVGGFTGLKDTRVLPLLFVRWQINDRWLLANPFRPGPTGPAGLELSYQPTRAWSWGAGGVFRNNRFRLDDRGSTAGGIADLEGVIGFVRVSHTWLGGRSANLFGGVLWDGEMTVEDEDGRRLFQQDFDPAPLVAISFGTRL